MSFAENIAHGRTQHPNRANYSNGSRQAFHHSRTTLGAAGHWIHISTVAAPLLIGEFVKDPGKRWRYLKLTSVGAAIASEAVWTWKIASDRKKDEEQREVLKACAER